MPGDKTQQCCTWTVVIAVTAVLIVVMSILIASFADVGYDEVRTDASDLTRMQILSTLIDLIWRTNVLVTRTQHSDCTSTLITRIFSILTNLDATWALLQDVPSSIPQHLFAVRVQEAEVYRKSRLVESVLAWTVLRGT